jgi:hypothetical protein
MSALSLFGSTLRIQPEVEPPPSPHGSTAKQGFAATLPCLR